MLFNNVKKYYDANPAQTRSFRNGIIVREIHTTQTEILYVCVHHEVY